MDLKALQADVLRISDIYAAEHGIDRDRDWALLKLQEEILGMVKVVVVLEVDLDVLFVAL